MILKFLSHKIGLSSEIPDPIGDYNVGVLPFRFHNGCYSKIFYPASLNFAPKPETVQTFQTDFAYNSSLYTRDKVTTGFSLFSRAYKMLFALSIGYTKINFKYFLKPILLKDNVAPKRFRVIIFSHGIAGNADIYSKICSDLASKGNIVIALEHEDGSGTYAYDVKAGKDIFYQHFEKSMKYTRENVVNFRRPFLDKRTKEINVTLDNLQSLKINLSNSIPAKKETQNNEKIANDRDETEKQLIENLVFRAMDVNEIYLAGHSFGACSIIKCAFDLGKTKTFKNIKGLILFDLWGYPLERKVEESGINFPILSIVCDSFYENNEYPITKRFLERSGSKNAFCIYDVTHAQFSDCPYFTNIPYINKKYKFQGDMLPEVSQKYIVDCVDQFLKDGRDFQARRISTEKFVYVGDMENKAEVA